MLHDLFFTVAAVQIPGVAPVQAVLEAPAILAQVRAVALGPAPVALAQVPAHPAALLLQPNAANTSPGQFKHFSIFVPQIALFRELNKY